MPHEYCVLVDTALDGLTRILCTGRFEKERGTHEYCVLVDLLSQTRTRILCTGRRITATGDTNIVYW